MKLSSKCSGGTGPASLRTWLSEGDALQPAERAGVGQPSLLFHDPLVCEEGRALAVEDGEGSHAGVLHGMDRAQAWSAGPAFRRSGSAGPAFGAAAPQLVQICLETIHGPA